MEVEAELEPVPDVKNKQKNGKEATKDTDTTAESTIVKSVVEESWGKTKEEKERS